MATVEMVMPKMGESIMEGTILSWLKKEGDLIEQDESVLEVATDKVDTEVPATHAGVLKKILAKEGEIIEVGKPIAIIEVKEDESDDPDPLPELDNPSVSDDKELLQDVPEYTSLILGKASYDDPANLEEKRFYSPLVQSIANQENVSAGELAEISGTAKGGRVTKKDILDYISKREATQIASEAGQTDEILEMDRMRKMIAQRMLDSKNISAHVTSFVEADLTNIVLYRNKIKDAFQAKQGEKITFTPFFIEAIAKALKDFPMMNISVEGDKIIKKKAINIGVAVALANGNLIVPVIKNADKLNLVGLSKKINELAIRARENRLSAEELKGGTYTLSNIGSFGNIMGTPIIVQPQVGILAVGTITKKPAVIESPTGDMIGIRHKMILSHSYDHRVVDGALGGMFVKKVADYLESFDMKTVI
ncbi:dihydrolipoamide acetyltransferase family protein [Cyclobacterium marinum]|uniref:Dihydrolipoamide acetyltransferase component of pyruvate dehydrogenase complex n=1 Tax=Cyclobacterium marinum (strain ATCC 25205 / DSM 745 / LMG 13164 / NCIMB 1802) TaxID=880070 RepID=G0J570_CYCMS|nr:dihydrolipoamide acetyltransferase family protein [Cyclobacterium marinum]AEL26754.1 catalytic domain-containing protein of components of various dehydrogenase complexes [Cyclobacterium marinum DSM 745]MBR9774594.1 2-oxo acid dehydrogenase subunit E2 [Cytophagales bacterium]|tara:strand:+ start:14206 stop:15471 length:1266 start_codon:yes stop_codon:yes gene_type:complete